VKAGMIPTGKYSVTISRYSGGQSLNVKIRELKTLKLIQNPERIRLERDEPHRHHNIPRWTEEGKRIQDLLQALVDAYNYDRSDAMSDYFDKNFYGFVDYDYDFTKAERELILENLE
jgi:hypothetical protein